MALRYAAFQSRQSRWATANHLTIGEVLPVLPAWFTTKTNNPDERAQHHMLAPQPLMPEGYFSDRMIRPAGQVWRLRLEYGQTYLADSRILLIRGSGPSRCRDSPCDGHHRST